MDSAMGRMARLCSHMLIYSQDYVILLKGYFDKMDPAKMLLTELRSHVLIYAFITGRELMIGKRLLQKLKKILMIFRY